MFLKPLKEVMRRKVVAQSREGSTFYYFNPQ